MRSSSPFRRSVHPRRRGERCACAHIGGCISGSSPQARGTPGGGCEGTNRYRFIPAGAGNAATASSISRSSAVHPRRRGERGRSSSAEWLRGGSSPQARGTPTLGVAPPKSRRFIPAGAGNARYDRAATGGTPVHPRRRGERLLLVSGSPRAIGSSPQARGTLSKQARGYMCRRFIPAGAGNASAVRSRGDDRPVHPRRRGERATSSAFNVGLAGSSPQARGTQLLAR